VPETAGNRGIQWQSAGEGRACRRGAAALLIAAAVGVGSATAHAKPRPADAASEIDVIGEARAVDGGALRYVEYHLCDESESFCQVEYRNTAGELVAVKKVDYSTSLQAPEFQLRDIRRGETRVVEGEFESDWVVDAGFDHFVRLQWQALVEGETISFPFLIAGRDKPLNMRARRREGGPCAAGKLCLRVTLDAWLLRMLVPPIDLVYDMEERQLLQFRGISNIRDGEGNTQQVQIDYRYPASDVGSDMAR